MFPLGDDDLAIRLERGGKSPPPHPTAPHPTAYAKHSSYSHPPHLHTSSPPRPSLSVGHHRCLLDSTNQSIILNDILVKMGVAAPINTAAAAAAATASQSMDDPYPLLSPYKGTQ